MLPTTWLLHETSEEYRAGKRGRGKCVTYRCRRTITLAARRQHNYKCATCKSRLFRVHNPDRYAYNNLKASAAKRDIGFEWAFEDFVEFCALTGYVELRGKSPLDLSVDRISCDQPYRPGNVRIMAYGDNVSHKFENRPLGP